MFDRLDQMVCFLSSRGGLLNVWALRFDPVRGAAVGQTFQVTHFDNPKLMIPTTVSPIRYDKQGQARSDGRTDLREYMGNWQVN